MKSSSHSSSEHIAIDAKGLSTISLGRNNGPTYRESLAFRYPPESNLNNNEGSSSEQS